MTSALPLSHRVLNMQASATLKMAQAARDLKERGIKVISLSAGEPDFTTPKSICELVKQSLDEGKTHYAPVQGSKNLIKALIHKFERDQKVTYDENEIIATAGAKSAILLALEAIVNEGDEVIIFSPYWVSYKSQVVYASGKVVEVSCDEKNNFMPTPEDLEKAITSKTKAIILNSPNNPTGAVISKEQLMNIANVLKGKNIYLISDEIYERLMFDKFEHYSPAALNAEMREKTIVISGMSKGYAMTGWRVGFAAGNKTIIAAMNKLQGQNVTCLPDFIQDACAFALKEEKELAAELDNMKKIYQERRDIALSLFNDLPLKPFIPQGAFYLWVDARDLMAKTSRYKKSFVSDTELAEKMLEEAHVATVAGSPFGLEGYLRLSIASSVEDIKEALLRIRNWLS